MKFSIIVPVYNRAGALKECLASILEQTYEDWECLIVDDGSNDETAKSAREYCDKDSRFRYFYKSNGGTASARNLGIKSAKGSWIAFLDSDDLFFSHALQTYRSAIDRVPEVRIVGAAATSQISAEYERPKTAVDKQGQFVDAFLYQLGFEIGGPELLPSCSCIEQGLIREIGCFIEGYEALEDSEFWIRATALHPVFYVPVPVTLYRRGQVSGETSKQDAVVADGSRTKTARQIYLDAPGNKFIQRRFQGDSAGYSTLVRLCASHAEMLESSLHIREGEHQAAMRKLAHAASLCHHQQELNVLVTSFKLSLYYPWTDHFGATLRYSRWIRQVLRDNSSIIPLELKAGLQNSLSDTYFKAAESYLRKRDWLRFSYLWAKALGDCFCWRTIKSSCRLCLRFFSVLGRAQGQQAVT